MGVQGRGHGREWESGVGLGPMMGSFEGAGRTEM